MSNSETRAAPGRSPWSGTTAFRTYASAALWAAGGVMVLLTGEADAAGWFQLRTDFAGLVLFAAALIGGTNFLPKAVRAIQRLRLDMNFLMSVAIIGALIIGEPFEAAAIAALFSFAELLESAAVSRARRSIEELVRLAPERARRVAAAGTEEEVPVRAVQAGDHLRVRPGEKIPIDGIVVDGESAVDESTVTGESVPVAKSAGDKVFAGTLLAEGYLEIKSTVLPGDTTLDRIVRLVREAQSRRAPSERFIERFAKVYTPVITVLAVITMAVPPVIGLGSGLDWFTRGLTLLVVACPCALVIATPVTIMSGITSAARHGVLIKGGEYMESLGGSCAFAFDKTGSLTEGRLVVTDIVALVGSSAADVLRIAAVVEARSEHPIARAIVAHAEARGIRAADDRVADFAAKTGAGVTARVNEQVVRVGTPALFGGAEPPTRFIELQDEGRTPVLVGIGNQIIGIIAVADRVRPDAARVVRDLRALGVHEMVMLTGDHARVAQRIAGDVGISDIRAQLLPEEKVRAIEEYRSAKHRVAMLGDGVNDAPALAAADVGIAMGGAGSPASIETADVALLGDDIRLLPYAVRLSQRVRRTLRFNVAVALIVKLVLAIGALVGAVSLLIAVLVGDLGASLVVTGNAMRIARTKV